MLKRNLNERKKRKDQKDEMLRNVMALHKIKRSIFSRIRGSIATKLIASFMIPVGSVIVLGIVSYNTAHSSITQSYKKSSLKSIEMTCEYLRFGFDSVEATALQYILDNQFQNYFTGENDEVQADTVKKNIKSTLAAKLVSDDFISDIHIISQNSKTITTAAKSENNMYDEFLKTTSGNKLVKKARNSYWFGYDDYLDKTFTTDKDKYAIRFVRGFVSGKACVILDIKSSVIKETMDNLDFGGKSIVAFVTSDGREVFAANKDAEGNNQCFINEEFYKKSLQAKESSGSLDISYKGQNYLYLYSKIGETGAMICSLIPETNIIGQVNGIKNVTIIVVLFSCIIAILIGAMIASGIQRTIRYFIGGLNTISEGNLTVKLKIKRRDEFTVLSDGINNMIDKMRVLIEKVKIQSTSVTASSEQVMKASNVFTNSSQGISESINEIQMGVTQQAEDSGNCLHQMDSLSDKIQVVSGKTTEISKIATETKGSVTKGIGFMESLNSKSKKTSEITERIINHIEILDEKSHSISKIVGTINSIAEQTNLLSLNASIEAARAGEFGRGFTVVAEEIRKLADQSVQSVKEIEGLIKEIQEQTKNAVVIANEAEHIVGEQDEAVKITEESFHNLNTNVEKLIDNVGLISESINNINSSRADTLSAIENISAVSQQTASAAITVYNTTCGQLDAVQLLNDLSKELDQNAQTLESVVHQFIVD